MSSAPSLDAESAVRGHQPLGYCPHCSYAIDPGRCPECGRDVPMPVSAPRRVRIRKLLMRVGCGLLLCGVAYAIVESPYYVLYYFTSRETLAREYYSGRRGDLVRRVIRAQRMELSKAVFGIEGIIHSELNAPGTHDWGGRYTIPEAANSFGKVRIQYASGALLLGPGGQYIWYEGECSGCSNLVDFGRVVKMSDDRMTLRSEFPYPIFGAAHTFELVRIRWNGRHFLCMARDFGKLKSQCDVTTILLAREEDLEHKVVGLPDSPALLVSAMRDK